MKNYKWTQTFYHVTLDIELEKYIKTKDITCDFKPNKLKLSITNNIIFDEILEHAIYPKESNWYIEKEKENNRLYIEMAKVETKDNKGWWLKCFKTDTEKIEIDRLTRSMYDCSPELQATTREMYAKMYHPGIKSANK